MAKLYMYMYVCNHGKLQKVNKIKIMTLYHCHVFVDRSGSDITKAILVRDQ
jgi:hypothetical protein